MPELGFWYPNRGSPALPIATALGGLLEKISSPIAADPGPPESYARSGQAYYALGSQQMARSSCEMKPDYWESRVCLALTFERLAQRRESDAQTKWLRELPSEDRSLHGSVAQGATVRGRDAGIEVSGLKVACLSRQGAPRVWQLPQGAVAQAESALYVAGTGDEIRRPRAGEVRARALTVRSGLEE